MSNRGLPANLRQLMRRAGIDLPKSIVKLEADNARVLAALDADAPAPLLPAAVKALREGRHPADDPDVVPLILRRQLAGSRFDDQIRDYLADDLADAYAAAFPDFIETWRPHFAEHAKNLHAAADKLGPLLGTDNHAAILRQGPAAAKAWQDATAAASVLDTIRDAWAQLSFTTARTPMRDRAVAVVAHDVDHWLNHTPSKDSTVVDLVRDGFRLELHTPDEVARFVAEVAETVRKREVLAADSQRRRLRPSLLPG